MTEVWMVEADYQGLNNFVETLVVSLPLRTDAGKFLIFGKLYLINDDGDWQNATARLTTLNEPGNNPGPELDRSRVRIGPLGPIKFNGDYGSQSISLLGKLELPAPGATGNVGILCSTYNGAAYKIKLSAVKIDILH
jgi:hypothetical protein